MKKLLTGLAVFVLAVCFAGAVKACEFEGLYDNYQAVYTPSAQTWTTGGMADGRIVLTKKTTEGSGNYSEYHYGNGKLAISLHSNFEFIKDGRLIAVDNAGLKYYEVTYNGKNFVEKKLCPDELHKLFPNAEIVKISQFTNNEYTVKKEVFQNKTLLLVNDTDKYFHKYSFSPKSVQQTDIKGLVKISHFGKIKFSLYGDKNNMLVIRVKCGKSCGCSIGCTCANGCTCKKDCNCKKNCDCKK